jgi:RNA polymerase sigma-70 factor (ECF subfamily)
MEPVALEAGPTGSTTMSSAVALVERARNGDEAAFEALLRERLDGLFQTACVILGDEMEARDALQDTCVSVWRNLPRLRDADRFDAWLMRVLVNACRMRLRKRSRVREIRIAPDFERAGPASDDPAHRTETESISRAFDRLDPNARALLVLHHLRHEPVNAIAIAMQVPPGTVKSRLHAARAALTRALERERR